MYVHLQLFTFYDLFFFFLLQGQEIVAENALELASTEGHWVILQVLYIQVYLHVYMMMYVYPQNIHLVAKWLPKLEKLLEQYSVGSNQEYRVYISAEPAGTPSAHIIPQGILESSIKITNEPPTGMLANLHKALDNFNQVHIVHCTCTVHVQCSCVQVIYYIYCTCMYRIHCTDYVHVYCVCIVIL